MVEPLTSGQPGNHSACSSACSRLLHLCSNISRSVPLRVQPGSNPSFAPQQWDQHGPILSTDEFHRQKTRHSPFTCLSPGNHCTKCTEKKKYQHILSSFFGHGPRVWINIQYSEGHSPTHPLFEELQQFLVVPNVLAKSRQVTQIFETLVDAPFSCLSRLGWAGTREEMVPKAKVRLKIYVKKAKYPQTSESRVWAVSDLYRAAKLANHFLRCFHLRVDCGQPVKSS